MKGLYVIADTAFLDARRTDPVAYVRAVLDVKPAAIQLRAKGWQARDMLAVLRALGPLCRGRGVPLVANDRADVASLAGCDMVHLGQSDLGPDLVHRVCPNLGLGVSTHDRAQLEAALKVRPTYVAYGPVFETKSKANPDPVVGIAGLASAAKLARAAGIPLVAIGGITLARAAEVCAHADAIAVISDLFPVGADLAEVTARARAYQALFAPTRSGALEAAP